MGRTAVKTYRSAPFAAFGVLVALVGSLAVMGAAVVHLHASMGPYRASYEASGQP